MGHVASRFTIPMPIHLSLAPTKNALQRTRNSIPKNGFSIQTLLMKRGEHFMNRMTHSSRDLTGMP